MALIITENADVFRLATEIARGFDASGLPIEANNVRRALTISTIPGEIFGELRKILETLRPGIAVNQRLTTEIDAALVYLNRIL